jgi:hypothetical protein
VKVNDQHHAPADLLPEKTGNHWIRGWVDLRTSQNMTAKRKIPSPVMYRTPVHHPVAFHFITEIILNVSVSSERELERNLEFYEFTVCSHRPEIILCC